MNLIKNSYPKFSIGIFGEWGTGKTTLMNALDETLEENKAESKNENKRRTRKNCVKEIHIVKAKQT